MEDESSELESSRYGKLNNFILLKESRDGAVLRVHASHQCGPGSIPGLGILCSLRASSLGGEGREGERVLRYGVSSELPVF